VCVGVAEALLFLGCPAAASAGLGRVYRLLRLGAGFEDLQGGVEGVDGVGALVRAVGREMVACVGVYPAG